MDFGALYRGIVETSPDGIWVFDLEGRTLYANSEIARMLGVNELGIANLTVFDSMDEAGQAQFRIHLEALRGGHFNSYEVECQFVRSDGTTFWVLVRESALFGSEGTLTGILHRVTDYSQRRQIINDLQTSQRRLAEAQRIARVGSWEWDVERDEITGSPELYALYALDPDTFPVTYQQFLSIVHEDDRAQVDEAVQSALHGADEFAFVVRVQGETDWVWTRGRGVAHRDTNGQVTLMSGTHQDVTEAKQVEEALEDQVLQNTLLKAVASAANEARTLAEVLSQARQLALVHDDWDRARGFVPAETGESVVPLYLTEEERTADLATPEVSAMELSLANDVFRERASRWDDDRLTIAFPVSFADEVCAVLTITSAPPLFRHEMIQAMVESIAVQLGRVAEREKAERALALARDEAMQASRQKSEFLATMTHEIRTPLNGVIGLNDLLLHTGLDSEQRRLASGVQIASRALLSVINDVLDFSKIEAGRFDLETLDFDVRSVFDQVASVLAESARAKGLELIIACHPDVPEVLSGDPTRLAQVLTNLVSNAVKFTEQGEVYVRATAEPQVDATTVLRVLVTDTGVGLRGKNVHDLFNPFTQADASTTRVYGGTGLGLAISKEIVEAFGGRLDYAPNPGGGSVFSFTAVFGAPSRPRSDPDDDYARTVLAGRRMLVVDDNEHNRLILDEQLARWGVRSVSVPSADEALVAVATAVHERDPFDGALLDMAMPIRDGLQLAQDIRTDSTYDDLTLLMLTSHTTPDPAQVSAAGIAVRLDKPVLASSLRAVLIEHLAGAAPSPSSSAPVATTRDHERHHVLLVEDNAVNQMVAIGILKSIGYLVDTVDDGLLALEALARHDYDAVLMDVQMPRMDGYAATREIRAREANGVRIPVIAMTAAAVEGERERCLAAGMDDFVTKPVDPAGLASVLSRWVGQDSSVPPPEPLELTMGAPASEPIEGLDTERLDMLRDLDPGDTTYLDRAIGNFLVNSRTAVDFIANAIGDGDYDSMRQAAHKLAGSALNLGVSAAGEAAREIEWLGDAGTIEGARELIPELERSLEQGRVALLTYQATYTNGS